ncbi:pumilio 15 [Capsicum chacoense]|nr:pumilio homolog 15 [Capsicum annuum]
MEWVNNNPENNSGKTPENNSGELLRRNGLTEFHPQPSIESLFGGLRIGGDRRLRTPTPSLLVSPVDTPAGIVGDDELLMSYRAQERMNNADFLRAYSRMYGAQQNLNVGPGQLTPGPDILVPPPSQSWYNSNTEVYSEDDYLGFNYNGYNVGSFLPSTASVLPIMPWVYDYSNTYLSRNLNFGAPNSRDNMGNNELRGKMVALAKDQQGSKMLQAKLEKGNKEEIEGMLNELIDSVGDLMKNQSGSYVIQKLFVLCNEEQRTSVIQAITRNTHQFIGICFSQHGARAMQKLLDNLSTPQQRSLILSAITPVAVALANDQSGQHVIQYCVKTFSIEYTRHLLNEIANNCFAIATQKSGCCVLQSCVESSRGELRDRLIAEILTNAVQLSEDQYGNYVVQHLVGLKLPRVTETLLDRLQGNFVTLSCNKYASNVVEKIILESGEEHCTRIISELLRSSSASMLLVDPYGNFVIQTALQISKGHVFNALYNLIYVNSASMQSNLYGKKILDRLFSKKEPLYSTRFHKRQV